VLDAGGGDDKIDVAQRRDGGLSVTTNGETFQLTATESKNLTIRGGTGADTITLDTGVTIGVTIKGGDGKDIIFGGAGADIINDLEMIRLCTIVGIVELDWSAPFKTNP